MASQNWFVCISGASIGPLTTEVVQLMLEQKRLSPMEFAWCEGMDSWKRVCEIEVFGGSALPELPSIPVPQASPKTVAPPSPPPTPLAKPAPAPKKAAPPPVAAPVAPPSVPKPAAASKAAPVAPAPAASKSVPVPPAAAAKAPAPAAPAGSSLKEKMIAKMAQKKAGIDPKPYVTIRRAERIESDAVLEIEGHGRFTILNMSAIGALLNSKKSVAPGTNLKFSFECKEIKKSPLYMTGVVVRDGVAQGKEEIAIEFTRVNPAHKRALQEYVESKLSEGKNEAA